MRRPWFELSPEVGTLFRDHIVELTDRTNAAIRAEFPGPRDDADAFWALSRASTTHAIESFVAGIEAHETVLDTAIFARVGRVQAQAGRDLEEALSQFRVGAAVIWREISTLGTEAGFAPASLFDVAEGLFVYIDELSGICARAYADQQAAEAGAVEASRSRLARLLLADPPTEPRALAAAAQAAGCRLDQPFAAVVVAEEHRESLRHILPPDTLPGPTDRLPCALLLDPEAPSRLDRLAAAADRLGIRVALGPTVAASDAGASMQQAQAAHRLMDRGLLVGEPLLHAGRHTVALLLTADPRLTDQLIGERLGPFDRLRPAARERLERTLRVWLDSHGRLTTVAARLSIHPKTVKYRMDQIRELFGTAIDDPDARFEIQLALHARELAAAR
jgi:hypothetical protein